MFNYSQGIPSSEPCRYDFALYPNKDNSQLHDIGENYSDYIDESDAILTYFYLINDQPILLLNAIEKILQRSLSVEENRFILTEYTIYRGSQNLEILLDPVAYYRTIEKTALTHLEKLKHHYRS